MTPHLNANLEDVTNTVIMPGDPLRAQYIAEKYLKDYKLINSIRNMLGFTGFYKDKKVTIMSHGIGNASIGIYSYELFKFYDVQNIIRIGTCGAYSHSLNLKDLILVDKSYSESSYAKQLNNSNTKIIPSSQFLNSVIEKTADNLNIKLNIGNIHCKDVFYTDLDYKDAIHNNCLGAEMESFALFHNSRFFNKNAACILTISDSLVKEGKLSPEERQTSLDKMIKLSLESAIEIL